MKTYNFIILAYIFILFCSGSCREKGQYFITIQNNSDKEMIFQGSLYSYISQDSLCMINLGATTEMEYQDFIYYKMIKPYSSKKIEIDIVIEYLQSHKNAMWSVGIFNRIDIDTMSCEEFKQKYPIKYEWKITLSDMEACNWTLVYPPEE